MNSHSKFNQSRENVIPYKANVNSTLGNISPTVIGRNGIIIIEPNWILQVG